MSNLESLYNTISSEYEVGSYESFVENLDDEEKRKNLYNELSKTYDLGTYESFNSAISYEISPDMNNLMTGSSSYSDGNSGNIDDYIHPSAFTPDSSDDDSLNYSLTDPTLDANEIITRQIKQRSEDERFMSWYKYWAKEAGLNPDPYHPDHNYDYKAAWKNGVTPEPVNTVVDSTDFGIFQINNKVWGEEFVNWHKSKYPNANIDYTDEKIGELLRDPALNVEFATSNIANNNLGLNNWVTYKNYNKNKESPVGGAENFKIAFESLMQITQDENFGPELISQVLNNLGQNKDSHNITNNFPPELVETILNSATTDGKPDLEKGLNLLSIAYAESGGHPDASNENYNKEWHWDATYQSDGNPNRYIVEDRGDSSWFVDTKNKTKLPLDHHLSAQKLLFTLNDEQIQTYANMIRDEDTPYSEALLYSQNILLDNLHSASDEFVTYVNPPDAWDSLTDEQKWQRKYGDSAWVGVADAIQYANDNSFLGYIIPNSLDDSFRKNAERGTGFFGATVGLVPGAAEGVFTIGQNIAVKAMSGIGGMIVGTGKSIYEGGKTLAGYDGKTMHQVWEETGARMEYLESRDTYEPRMNSTHLLLGIVGSPFESWSSIVELGAEASYNHFHEKGYDNLAAAMGTIVKAGGEILPYLLPFLKGKLNASVKANYGVNISVGTLLFKNQKVVTALNTSSKLTEKALGIGDAIQFVNKKIKGVHFDNKYLNQMLHELKNSNKKQYNQTIKNFSKELGMTTTQFLKELKSGKNMNLDFVRYTQITNKAWFESLRRKMGYSEIKPPTTYLQNGGTPGLIGWDITIGKPLNLFKEGIKYEYVKPTSKTKGTGPSIVSQTTGAPKSLSILPSFAELKAAKANFVIGSDGLALQTIKNGPNNFTVVGTGAASVTPSALASFTTKANTPMGLSKDIKVPTTLYHGSGGSVKPVKLTGKEKILSGGDNPLTLVKTLADNGVKGAKGIKTWAEANQFLSKTFKKDYDLIQFDNKTRPQLGNEYIRTKDGKSLAEVKEHAEVYAKSTGRDKKYKAPITKTQASIASKGADKALDSKIIPIKSRPIKTTPKYRNGDSIKNVQYRNGDSIKNVKYKNGDSIKPSISTKPKTELPEGVSLKENKWSTVKKFDDKATRPIQGIKIKGKDYLVQLQEKGGKRRVYEVDINGKQVTGTPLGKNFDKAKNALKKIEKEKLPPQKATEAVSIKQKDLKRPDKYSKDPYINKKLIEKNEIIRPLQTELTTKGTYKGIKVSDAKKNQLLRSLDTKADVIDMKIERHKLETQEAWFEKQAEGRRVDKTIEVYNKKLRDLQESAKKKKLAPGEKFEIKHIEGILKRANKIQKELAKYKARPEFYSTIIPGLPQALKLIENFINKKRAKPLVEEELLYIETTIEKFKSPESKNPIPDIIKKDVTPKGFIERIKNYRMFEPPEQFIIDFEKSLKTVEGGVNYSHELAMEWGKPLKEFIKDNNINPQRMRVLLHALEGGYLTKPKVQETFASITPKEKLLMETYKGALDALFSEAVQHGIMNDKFYIEDYVSHMLNTPPPPKLKGEVAKIIDKLSEPIKVKKTQTGPGKFGVKPYFTKTRYYNTLKELEAKGLDVNYDMVSHIQNYTYSLYKAISNKNFIDHLKLSKTQDGFPLITYNRQYRDLAGYKQVELPGLAKFYHLGDAVVMTDHLFVHPDISTALKSFSGQLSKRLNDSLLVHSFNKVKYVHKRIAMMNPVHHGINIASDIFVENNFNPWRTLKQITTKSKKDIVLHIKMKEQRGPLEIGEIIDYNNPVHIRREMALCNVNMNYVSAAADRLNTQFNKDITPWFTKDVTPWNQKSLKNKVSTAIDHINVIKMLARGSDKLMWEGIVGNSQIGMFLDKKFSVLEKEGYVVWDKKKKQYVQTSKELTSEANLNAGQTAADYVNNNLGTLGKTEFSDLGGFIMDKLTFAKNWTAGWVRQAVTMPSKFITKGHLIRGGKINLLGKKFNPIPRFARWKGQTKAEFDWTRGKVGNHVLKAGVALVVVNELLSQFLQTKKWIEDEDWEFKEWKDLLDLIILPDEKKRGGTRETPWLDSGKKFSDRLKIKSYYEDPHKPGHIVHFINPLFKFNRDILLSWDLEHLAGKADPTLKMATETYMNRSFFDEQKIIHPGSTQPWKDYGKFLWTDYFPPGRWIPNEDQLWSKWQKLSPITGIWTSSIHEDAPSLEFMWDFANTKDYIKEDVDKKLKVILMNPNSTTEANWQDAIELMSQYPELYSTPYINTVVNKQLKAENMPLYYWENILGNRAAQSEFQLEYVDEFGLDAWKAYAIKYGIPSLDKKE